MKAFGLDKDHKLCSETAIEMLFARGTADAQSALAYPLRAVWREHSARRDQSQVLRFLISIPKKRLKRAVWRVLMRRRVREAFRLHWRSFPELDNRGIDLALIYVADKECSYARVEGAVVKLLEKIDATETVNTAD
ncbi:MAG: ribonuclease P protein component [Bacteroidales bacterium]|nr:ribonuclease P protein component [Bacteroidales bacterium]MCD8395438.1 ribonuclease P protein component [Bacteroidales bacterium]